MFSFKGCISLLFILLSSILIWLWADSDLEFIKFTATAFSILSGFLMTVSTIVANPRVDDGLSWRFYENRRNYVVASLLQARVLLTLYFILILFVKI